MPHPTRRYWRSDKDAYSVRIRGYYKGGEAGRWKRYKIGADSAADAERQARYAYGPAANGYSVEVRKLNVKYRERDD